MIHGLRESDSPVVPAKSSNKAMKIAAEKMEERGLTKGNSSEQNIHRTQGRESMKSALSRIRQSAKKDKEQKFTALLHHIYNLDTLREAYYGIKRNASTGIDGKTWREYGKNLEENLQKLSDKIKRGAYRAKTVLRVFIPKVDGKRRPIGIIIVRYADDIIMGFQCKTDADLFMEHLKLRFQKFNLELHPDKTRLIEFGRFAEDNRNKRGGGKPETFNFLGFTHICSKNRRGRFKIIRKTNKKKLKVKLKEIKKELRRRLHWSIMDVGKWLNSVVRGHMNYFAVPGNFTDIKRFRHNVSRLWLKSLRRRSQKHKIDWERMDKIINRWLPYARIMHPYPETRFDCHYPR